MFLAEMYANTSAPIKAPAAANIPNRTAIFQLMCFHTRPILKKLLSKWTIPVSAIATSTGKNASMTGVSKVASPNPLKKVRKEAMQAVSAMSMLASIDSR